MAHSIKPNTNYILVTLTVAIEDGPQFELSDVLNEALRPLVLSEDPAFADYTLYALRKTRRVKSSLAPEEGELFDLRSK